MHDLFFLAACVATAADAGAGSLESSRAGVGMNSVSFFQVVGHCSCSGRLGFVYIRTLSTSSVLVEVDPDKRHFFFAHYCADNCCSF